MRHPRRRFLLEAALGVAGVGIDCALSSAKLWANPLGLPIGLELYTVRHELEKDFDGTLRKVAEIGYKEVEPYSFLNRKAAQIRQTLSGLGLSCPAGHYGLPQLKSGLKECIGYAKELGLSYMVCSFLQPAERKSLDDYRQVAEVFNRVGEQCQKAGIQFGYHNHNFEFTKFDGVEAFDELLRKTDPKLVNIELDCYWATRAGKDPVAFFRQYPGRFPILHVKDMKPGQAPTTDPRAGSNAFTEVGRGSIDWKRIFSAAREGGVKHYFVEQDKCERAPLESAKVSFEYLRNLKA
jgi:sugar phosphate isomerase/epimerase